MYTGGCLHCTFDKSALFQQIKTKCWYNNPGRNWRVKPVPKGRVAVWEKAQNGHAVRSSEICPGAGDTAAIWAEPTATVSISVQRKPAVWTGGGQVCPEEGVCFFLWCVCVERDGSILLLIWSCMCHFLSCVFICDPHPTSVLLSTLRLLCLVTSTLLTSHTGLQTFLQFGNFPYLRGGLLKSKAKGKDEKMR